MSPSFLHRRERRRPFNRPRPQRRRHRTRLPRSRRRRRASRRRCRRRCPEERRGLPQRAAPAADSHADRGGASQRVALAGRAAGAGARAGLRHSQHSGVVPAAASGRSVPGAGRAAHPGGGGFRREAQGLPRHHEGEGRGAGPRAGALPGGRSRGAAAAGDHHPDEGPARAGDGRGAAGGGLPPADPAPQGHAGEGHGPRGRGREEDGGPRRSLRRSGQRAEGSHQRAGRGGAAVPRRQRPARRRAQDAPAAGRGADRRQRGAGQRAGSGQRARRAAHARPKEQYDVAAGAGLEVRRGGPDPGDGGRSPQGRGRWPQGGSRRLDARAPGREAAGRDGRREAQGARERAGLGEVLARSSAGAGSPSSSRTWASCAARRRPSKAS